MLRFKIYSRDPASLLGMGFWNIAGGKNGDSLRAAKDSGKNEPASLIVSKVPIAKIQWSIV